MNKFLPEGFLSNTKENEQALSSIAAITEAMNEQRILEARALLCDSDHNLIVDLGTMRGIIPRVEGAVGISDGTVRDIAIISKVGKPVCFVVTSIDTDKTGRLVATLSRKKAQEICGAEYINGLTCGDIIDTTITHLEPFGAFCDIACGIPSLLPIDSISVSRISHPKDRFSPGDRIKTVIKNIEGGRITLSQKELLGTWEENAQMFSQGETVSGIIRSVEDYGVFVELTPNLAGLAEPKPGIAPGEGASVYIKSIIPEKMKVKLIIIDSFEDAPPPGEPSYFIESGHIDNWQYSPQESVKIIETVFN